MENNDPGFAVLISSSKKRVVIAGFHYQEPFLIKIRPRPRERMREMEGQRELTALSNDFMRFERSALRNTQNQGEEITAWLLIIVVC